MVFRPSKHRRWHSLALCLPIIAFISVIVIRIDQATPPQPTAGAKQRHSQVPTSQIDPSLATAWQLVASKRTTDQEAEITAGPALEPNFIDRHVSGDILSFTLPDESLLTGRIELSERDENGFLHIHGKLTRPYPGTFFLQRQTTDGIAGPFVGNIRFDGKPKAWKLEPSKNGKHSRFILRDIDSVICANYSRPPQDPSAIAAAPQNAPQTHPNPIPVPPGLSIIPLQSLPGATAVVYLDFDGEKGPFPGWGTFDAAPANASNNQIYDVWKMVCEDFQGFNINITTDRRVFDEAPLGRRQQVIITPTTDAAPGSGGVAYLDSFNWAESRPCWAFYSTGKASAEVISHEIGHTLGLSHDGRTSPQEDYYLGHGSGVTGWGPIMGAAYSPNLSQWSKGEYLAANQTQDDLAIITTQNNDVDYRVDDSGQTLATSAYLEIFPDQSVANEGILERTGDIDAFRFSTAGGLATLTANTVSLNPNLDLLAEIVHAQSSAVIASANPEDQLNATVSADLPAGEYLLRIRATGKGDPLGTGYTNYGGIGSYLISGSVSGAVQPARFSIAENSPNGSTIGLVSPRLDHGTNPLTWTITSGNTNSAFGINPTTGLITVANQSVLNYESLSTRWDDPANLVLFITITDQANPSLNETIRTVITIADINEAPSAAGITLTMLERTAPGTKIATISGSDPDRFDFPNYAITSGNTGNAFAIDPATGIITTATSIENSANTTYNLTVTLSDQGTPPASSTVNVTLNIINIAEGYTPGSIVRTFFDNITGTQISNLTGSSNFPNNPDSEEFLSSFDGGPHGDNFGSTIRGYLIPPATGTYRFWIASDNTSQLRFTTTTNPDNVSIIASVNSSTNRYAWTTSFSQRSSSFNLTGGQPYFIEVRHKEGTGSDHVAVAWTGPGIPNREVIPGLFLAPFYQNYAPKITTTSFKVRENAINGFTIGTVPVTDVNSSDTFSAYTITAGNAAGIFDIDPATGRLFVAQSSLLNATSTPSHTLTVRASDNGSPSLNGSGSITIEVLPASTIATTNIEREIWTGIAGTSVSSLTANTNYPFRPNTRIQLTSFDSGTNYADSYGSRIRARFIPPSTGDYRFYIASDDNSRLLFSTDPGGSGAAEIARVSSWTDANQWTKFTTQASTVTTLSAGQPVYLETLHKEGGGGDHISVGYTGPGVSEITVIPGSMLRPFDINAAPVFSPSTFSFTLPSATPSAGDIVGTVTATDPNDELLTYGITSGNSSAAFAIHPATGTITITNPSLLPQENSILQIQAQDTGLENTYPLKSATASVTINVPVVALPPDANQNSILDSWETLKFGNAAPGANPPGDDPDHDGLSNFLEYALDTHPLQPNATPLTHELTPLADQQYLLLTVPKNPLATELIYRVEVASTLDGPWLSNTTTDTEIIAETPAQLIVRDRTPVSAADRRFIRLHVRSPSP